MPVSRTVAETFTNHHPPVKTIHRIGRFPRLAYIALFAFATAFFNPHGMSTILGTSFPVPNATTKTNLTDLTSKAQEELWVKSVVWGADEQYQENPFADGMTGGKFSGKAVIQIKDTERVNGSTINIPLVGGFGGNGVQGENTRLGNEQKMKIGNMTVTIGRYWFGYSWTAVARDETVIGGPLDKIIRTAMREQFAKKKSDDILMKFIETAGTTGRNYMLPDGVASRAALTSANVMSTALISKAGLAISGLGGKPMALSKDAAGSTKKAFTMLSTDRGLLPLETEDAFLNAFLNADARGAENGVWTGKYKDWFGHALYRWNQIDHGNQGPIGSPLLPRGLLGEAVTAANDAVIKFGGTAAAAALTTPQYSQFFSNAPYTYHNGQTIAAVTNVDRYIRITNPDGSYAVCKYRLNDGNRITLHSSGAVVSIGTGTETTTMVLGAVIEECNVLGTRFCRHLELAQEAMAAGYGAIDGTVADPKYGKRTEELLDHGMQYAVGCEQSWGCAPIKRWDGVYPNFIVIETALPQTS